MFSYIIYMYMNTVHFRDDAWRLSMELQLSSRKGESLSL